MKYSILSTNVNLRGPIGGPLMFSTFAKKALLSQMKIEKPKLTVEINTDNPEVIEMISRYWETNPDGTFKYKSKDLAKEYNLNFYRFLLEIKTNSKAYDPRPCASCNTIYRFFRSRGSYEESYYYHYECHSCRNQKEEEKAKQEQEQKRIKAEVALKEKKEKMRLAFEAGAYQSLTLIEFNLLHALVINNGDLIYVQKKLGLSGIWTEKIIFKLLSMNILDSDGKGGILIDPDLEKILRNTKPTTKVKSIFGSPKAQDAFRILKKEHAFVYPEIPVCTFVEKRDVAHLFTDKMGEGYFLTSRVDFIVCDAVGMPIFAVEYQGGYHEDPAQQKKDEFKRAILAEVGIPLREMTAADLKA